MAIPNQFGNNDGKMPSEDTPERPSLVSWVVSRVQHARNQRDARHATRWEEYTRLWRGFWTDSDKNNDSERSKLIAPTLQQAIEMTVAEMEEAIFGKEAWFDIEDDLADENVEDALLARDNLLEDFKLCGVTDAISKVILLGAIYGTGIGKLNIVRYKEMSIDQNGEAQIREYPKVILEPIRPDEFVIDPAATTIDDALFCAHEVIKPRHSILQKQRDGIYNPGYVGTFSGQKRGNTDGTGATSSYTPDDNAVLITEYYGKVPRQMIPGAESREQMVEAIVVIANEQTLLKAVESPFTMKDRPIIAYQHDTVPGEFWGRGVSEKGYNPQKALDAELRARIDALALMTAPMMGADITRLPRNPELRVRPGKTVFTRGRPSEIYEPVAFGNPAQLGATFQHTGDLERMVQMGTGAMDSMTPTGISRRNETAGGMSMMLAGALKRTKRTMQNIERQFLNPLIRKSIWRYMQFVPERYPADYKFIVNCTMGIMAKEVENQQLVQMLGFTPPESPAHNIILKAMFDNTASSEKRALKEAIDALLAPPSPEQQAMQQKMQELEIRAAEAEVAKKEAEVAKLQAEAELRRMMAYHELIEAELEDEQLEIQAANAAVAVEKVRQGDRNLVVQMKKINADLQKEAMKARTAEKKEANKPKPKGGSK